MSKYVVYDLEMCKVPKGEKREEFGSRQELIQIGAVTGIDCNNGAHDALIDARNTAMLFAKINLEPELQMSKYYLTEDDMSYYRSSGILPRLCYAQ